MFKILNLFRRTPVSEITVSIRKCLELILLDAQIEKATEEHAKWAMKWYLQLVLDGLPVSTAAKQTSFKFFGSYQ